MQRSFLRVSLSVGLFAALASTGVLRGQVLVNKHLALGDSVPFGMNPLVLLSGSPTPNAFVGYPEVMASVLKLGAGMNINAACPGETSGSFLDTAALDNGCNSPHIEPTFTFAPFKSLVPPLLHVPYTGSQMNFALRTLRGNSGIDLVTLAIGSNDLSLLAGLCSQNPATFQTCVQQNLPGVLRQYAANLTNILTQIRRAYRGRLILVKAYTPNTNPLFAQAIVALNLTMVAVGSNFNSMFAESFLAFQIASLSYGGDPCAAGLLIPLPSPPFTPGCDVHPTLKGQQILAAAVLANVR